MLAIPWDGSQGNGISAQLREAEQPQQGPNQKKKNNNTNKDRNTNRTLKPHKHLSHSYPITGAVWSVGAEPVTELEVTVPSILSP